MNADRRSIMALIVSLRRAERLLCPPAREDLTPSAQWLRDNARALYGLAYGLRGGELRRGAEDFAHLRQLCAKLCGKITGPVQEAALCREIKALAGEKPLTVRALRALPGQLERALLGRLCALLPAIIREYRAWEAGKGLSAAAAGGRAFTLPREAVTLWRALDLLAQSGQAEAARRLEGQLRQRGQSARQVKRQAQEALERTAAQTGALVSALLSVPRLNGARVTEKCSAACGVLRRCAGFMRMDGESRGLYLTQAGRLARRLGVEEAQICEAALALCQGKTGAQGDPGYYLLEDISTLCRALGKRPPLLNAKGRVYLYAALLLLGAALGGVLGALLLPWYGVAPFVFVGSAGTHRLLERACARLLPRRLLPRLKRSSLPPEARVLAVVPTVLLHRRHALRMCRRLSVLYLANEGAPVDFMLLSDFTDAPREEETGDGEIVSAAAEGVNALRRAHGGRFYYLQRGRSRDEKNGLWCGRERKRGALALLGCLLEGEAAEDPLLYCTVDPAFFAHRYSHAITLDADTFLPAGAAEKLLGALLHPLQQGRITVIQPRMLTLPMHVQTHAQYLLGGRSGAEGYGAAAADLYQDAFGRGSFMGKGIYEPAAFRAATQSLPAGRVLSHDLIEGELAHAALAEDVVCYDGHPRQVGGFLKRAHRWTRGDWQLLPFLFDGRLDLLSRLKLWDNLRRSLTPALRGAALFISALQGAYIPFFLALLPLFSPQALGELLVLPASALCRLDAAARALWRQLVSHKKLLEWTTAAQAEEGEMQALRAALPPMLCGAAMLFASAPSVFWPGFSLGALWLCYPLLARWMDRPRAGAERLSPGQTRFLQGVARDTLGFFEAHVTERTRFLPPDNVQVSPPRGEALRTSPTNMGMYLLALCAACEMRLISGRDMLERMARTLDTLERLPAWHGIPYNWYDLDTLQPLPPRFVSSVDAGNYLAALLASAQAARGHLADAPPELQGVPARLDALGRRMQLGRLYDRRRRLFYVGFEEEQGRMSAGRYDLLASEAQLLSYAAIATGQVREEHWWRLGRPWTKAPGRALLSWSGTAFEYMLPALLLPTWEDSLLHTAQQGCFKAQRRAGRGELLGISESGYAQLDPGLNYRYQAFGVRALALDASCREGVYAPYAAALLLRAAPRAACGALMRMRALGAYGEEGFYEAVDCAQGSPRVVRSHMAHHQGMLLCALCNALCGDYLPRLMLQLPCVQAHLPLLNELPPRRVPRLPRPLRAHRDRRQEAPFRLQADSALPADALLLSGGGVSLLVNGRGHARLFRGDVSLTRFDPRQGALSGPQLYLAGEGISALRLTGGEYTFSDGAARCRARQAALQGETALWVDPVTGAAVYRVRLHNMGGGSQRLKLVFYLEPALEEQRADSAHTAFSNLFLLAEQTGENACLLRRRSREGGAERRLQVRAWGEDLPILCAMMNDRALLLGREGSMETPLGLFTAPWKLREGPADCLALGVDVELDAGQQAAFCFALGEQTPPALEEALRGEGLARLRGQAGRSLLGIDARLAALACRLAGALLYAGDAPGPAQVGDLWRLGISGDKPLLALAAEGEEALTAAGQAALLLAFLCENGAEAELALLLPREEGYEQPLRAFCEGLSLRPRLRALQGRVHVLAGLGEEEREGLLRLAAVRLCGEEPLAGQLKKRPEAPPLYSAAPGGALPVLPRLSAYNGFGGFMPDHAYAVCATAPAPWCHILSGSAFGTLVGEQGILYSHAGNSRLRRLTRVCQDSVLTEPSEEYFLSENGRSWSLTRRPLQNTACRAVYEMGAAVYQCALPGLSAALTCFADAEYACGGRVLLLRNTSGETRRLQVTAAVRFFLGEDGRGTCAQARGDAVLARGGGLPGTAFFYLRGARSHTAPEADYGIGGALRRPGARGSGSVGVLETEIALPPGGSATLAFFLGHCETEEALLSLLPHLTPGRERLARAVWQRRLDGLRLYLPDPLLEDFMNGFLPYQIRASRLEMRAGFWQSGGAWGFRDQLQDMLSLLYTEPDTVRAHLLLCASRQYEQGDVQHWWHPGGAGVRTRISDDRLFLPYVTARYVQVTGDEGVLRERACYLRSAPLAQHERDRYETAEATQEADSLLAHCLRALDSLQYGPHGIPRMAGGDWNDGMNAVGGESAWLGFFLIVVLRDFAPLCEERVRDEMDRRRIRLQSAMQAAWTGKWFLRAWYEDGRTLGAPDSPVPRIDLISQCFAAFAGMPRDQVRKALEAAWQALHREKEGITLLLTPPFTPEEKAGYIGAYAPGVRENGGQYTHALPWLMRALLESGQRERAWQLLYECLPYTHSDTRERALHYRAEPYVLAADIHVNGRGGWTWYTGSAGWLREVFLRDFLGFDKRGAGVRLCPRLPEGWEECTVLYRCGRSRWQLTASRDAHYITLDGEKVTGAYVPLRDDGRAHDVRFPLPPRQEE